MSEAREDKSSLNNATKEASSTQGESSSEEKNNSKSHRPEGLKTIAYAGGALAGGMLGAYVADHIPQQSDSQANQPSPITETVPETREKLQGTYEAPKGKELEELRQKALEKERKEPQEPQEPKQKSEGRTTLGEPPESASRPLIAGFNPKSSDEVRNTIMEIKTRGIRNRLSGKAMDGPRESESVSETNEEPLQTIEVKEESDEIFSEAEKILFEKIDEEKLTEKAESISNLKDNLEDFLQRTDLDKDYLLSIFRNTFLAYKNNFEGIVESGELVGHDDLFEIARLGDLMLEKLNERTEDFPELSNKTASFNAEFQQYIRNFYELGRTTREKAIDLETKKALGLPEDLDYSTGKGEAMGQEVRQQAEGNINRGGVSGFSSNQAGKIENALNNSLAQMNEPVIKKKTERERGRWSFTNTYPKKGNTGLKTPTRRYGSSSGMRLAGNSGGMKRSGSARTSSPRYYR